MKRKKATGTKRKGDTPVTERRALGAPCEFRADADGVLRGYAAVFDEEVEIFPGFREKVRRGAFKKTITESPDIRALWNHDTNFVMGRTTNGTLQLREDDHGLAIEIHPPDSQWARDDVESIRRGDVTQMSFAFRVIKSLWIEDEEDDSVIRELLEVRLFEVSPVTFPAYPTTEIALNQARGKHCGLCKCADKVGPDAGEVHSGLAPSESDTPGDHPDASELLTSVIDAYELEMLFPNVRQGTITGIKIFDPGTMKTIEVPFEPIQRGDETDHSGEKENGVANLTTDSARQREAELLLQL